MYQGDKQNYIPESSVYSDREILKAIHEVSKSKSKGQQREPAWFHPFPARMPISLAEHLIGRITAPEAVILDPMAGSGTTLIAEILRGVQKQQEINYKQAADRKEQPTPTTIFIEEAHEFLSAQRIQKMQVLF